MLKFLLSLFIASFFCVTSTFATPIDSLKIVWPIDGDLNYDGVVNLLDLQILASNFGDTGDKPTPRKVIEDAFRALRVRYDSVRVDTVYASVKVDTFVIVVFDTIYAGATVTDTIVSIGGYFRQGNWDADADDDGIEGTVFFYDGREDRVDIPFIYAVKVTLWKYAELNILDDQPIFEGTPYWHVGEDRYDGISIRIPNESYRHLVVDTGENIDRRYGVIKFTIETSKGTFSNEGRAELY